MNLRYVPFVVIIANFAACTFVHAVPHEGTNHDRKPDNNTARLLYQYPIGTWIENIAIRPNGNLLLTILSSSRLDQLDPFSNDPVPETVYNFPNATSVTGIAEIDHDVFTTAVGNFSLAGGGSTAGSWSVWKTDFSNGYGRAVVDKIVDLPDLTFPNGMCNLPSTRRKPEDILLGDIDTGRIWRLDPRTGSHDAVIKNSLTATAANPIFGIVGVNGIHVRDHELYFTNTGQALFAKMPIHADGTSAGSPRVVSYFSNSTQYADDFALGHNGDDAFLVTGSGNSIERVGVDGVDEGKGRIVAGSVNSTRIAEPTACTFGRTEGDREVLYVVTAGGMASPVNGNEVVGGQVLAVDVRGWKRETKASR
ncbi:hypothetical protein M409DRAFT_22681 [Zasmidium cellare ATCC 36951]|uniref:SMP-30/Gluconolactonase/LRE-like region domain-containing protein n=1 Tax=Zasmidium cellare ATCC 36951 TaxID=1080233 RepID=A0A6A6CJ40_ZASCE|nr:uncharacterized protein M409DRAFT_22681 [Zasmidium cellare ATCC 36951]KAF2167254.1 hypothetical protein M409DRAFT_22681 [Zasmidium cellare ATCC 36951]